MLAPPRNDGLCHSLCVIPHTHAVILSTLSVIPHTHVVILSIAKNLVIGVIVSLLLPDPSTPLRCAQDDKGKELSGRVQGGFREDSGSFREDSGRAGSLGSLSLIVLCSLPVPL